MWEYLFLCVLSGCFSIFNVIKTVSDYYESIKANITELYGIISSNLVTLYLLLYNLKTLGIPTYLLFIAFFIEVCYKFVNNYLGGF